MTNSVEYKYKQQQHVQGADIAEKNPKNSAILALSAISRQINIFGTKMKKHVSVRIEVVI
jgi:hypothetical protein